jgi:hypothetical protein
MSAQDNLGRQWQQPELSFTGYRGLTQKPKKEHGLAGLGMHWSADPKVARKFAGPFGHVVHAEIPISSVETNTQVLRNNAVFLPDHEQGTRMEKEIPVRRTVKVTKIEGPEADKKTGAWNGRRNEGFMGATGAKRPPRKRTYKNPKEMTA